MIIFKHNYLQEPSFKTTANKSSPAWHFKTLYYIFPSSKHLFSICILGCEQRPLRTTMNILDSPMNSQFSAPFRPSLQGFLQLLALPLNMAREEIGTDRDGETGQGVGRDRRELYSNTRGTVSHEKRKQKCSVLCPKPESLSEIYSGTDFDST